MAVGIEEMIDDTRVVGVLDIHILDTYIHTYIHPCVRVAPRVDGVGRRDGIDATPSPRRIHTIHRHAIVSSSVGPEYYVSVMSFVNQDLLEPGCSVLLHNKVMGVVGILSDDTDPMVSVMKVDKAPLESYADIGGLETQIQEIKEAVELPLAHPELYEEVGIKPPKGVILYGVPGTGKTLLAKAVANQTSATFLRVVGSELIQKYLGDGPKFVRELLELRTICLPRSCSSTRSTRSVRSAMILNLEVLGRSSGRCSSCSINWTALMNEEM